MRSALALAVVALVGHSHAADFHGAQVSDGCGTYLSKFDEHMFPAVDALKVLREGTQTVPVGKAVADAAKLGEEIKSIYETRFKALKFSELK